jgi:hypothetical protein
LLIGSPKKDENAHRDSVHAQHDEPIEKQEFKPIDSIEENEILKANSQVPQFENKFGEDEGDFSLAKVK